MATLKLVFEFEAMKCSFTCDHTGEKISWYPLAPLSDVELARLPTLMEYVRYGLRKACHNAERHLHKHLGDLMRFMWRPSNPRQIVVQQDGSRYLLGHSTISQRCVDEFYFRWIQQFMDSYISKDKLVKYSAEPGFRLDYGQSDMTPANTQNQSIPEMSTISNTPTGFYSQSRSGMPPLLRGLYDPPTSSRYQAYLATATQTADNGFAFCTHPTLRRLSATTSTNIGLETQMMATNLPTANQDPGSSIIPEQFLVANSPHGFSMPNNFQPSWMVLAQNGLEDRWTENQGSVKYRGSMNSVAWLETFEDLPDEENCALFVMGVPLSVRGQEIFQHCHSGVTVLHMYPPTETFPFQAAKIVFTTPEGAKGFYDKAKSYEGVWIHGRRLYIKYNRHGVKIFQHWPKSRVIVIEGPAEIMAFQRWDSYFRQFSIFKYENIRRLVPSNPANVRVEFRFFRIDGQAETIMQAITKNATLMSMIEVSYGKDPYDPPPNAESSPPHAEMPLL